MKKILNNKFIFIYQINPSQYTMKDFELFANKIKDNYAKQREVDINLIDRNCKVIRDDFEKLIKKISEETNPKGLHYNNSFGINIEINNITDLKKACKLDINDYKNKLTKITGLNTEIRLISFGNPQNVRWEITLMDDSVSKLYKNF